MLPGSAFFAGPGACVPATQSTIAYLAAAATHLGLQLVFVNARTASDLGNGPPQRFSQQRVGCGPGRPTSAFFQRRMDIERATIIRSRADWRAGCEPR